jgi:hypothetical protein
LVNNLKDLETEQKDKPNTNFNNVVCHDCRKRDIFRKNVLELQKVVHVLMPGVPLKSQHPTPPPEQEG